MKVKHFFSYALVAAFLLTFLTACPHRDCDKDEVKPTDCHKDKEKTAIIEVKMAICGVGFWQNLWFFPIEADIKNKWFRPYEVSAEILRNGFKPEEGQVLEITYSDTKLDGRYDSMISCSAYPGESDPIFINTIKILKDATKPPVEANLTARFKKVDCNVGVWGGMWLEVEIPSYDPNNKDSSEVQMKKVLLYPFSATCNFPKIMPKEGDVVKISFSDMAFVRPDESTAACKIEKEYRTVSINSIVW